MAGGSGTRLWPMSRSHQPKQLIPFIRDKSLLQIAAERLDGLIDAERRYICTGEAYRAQIREAMPAFADANILGEPEGRDTLGAVAFPAAVIAQQDPDAVIAVFTADHLIEPIDVFQQRVDVACSIAEHQPDTLVTFGIEPTHAATGFGYVELADALDGFDGAHRTAAFKEKPDAATAQQYLDSGSYLWNSGMFVWRASTLLGCVERYEPEVYAGVMKIAEAWDTPDRGAVLAEVYPTLKKISVDFAVMEPAGRDERVKIATVRMPVNWLDVGSWPAFGQTLDADGSGNRVEGVKATLLNSRDNVIVGNQPEHLIATIGVEGLVVIHTERATLICPADQAQRIKELHKLVGEQHGEAYL